MTEVPGGIPRHHARVRGVLQNSISPYPACVRSLKNYLSRLSSVNALFSAAKAVVYTI